MKHLLYALLALLLLSGASAHADCSIAVASDPHFIAPALTDAGACYQRVLENGDGKFMPYNEEILDAFLEEMLELRPDALLLTGDLTFNGAVISHEALAEKLRVLRDSGIPVLVLPGNHDVYNSNAAKYLGESFSRVPSANTEIFRKLYREFGPEGALSRDINSFSYLYPLNESTRLLMLDFNTESDFCGISESTLRWVEQQLEEARAAGAEVLAAGHQNLFQHTLFYDGYVIHRSEELAELLRNYGVRLFLSGHLHVQHIRTENGLTEIAASALCSYPCQYAILRSENGSLNYETKRLDMASWAERNGRTEPVFQDFQTAAAEYMKDHFRAEKDEWLQEINLAYFSGDLRGMDASPAAAWEGQNDLTAYYVRSVVEDIGNDFTHWSDP